MLKAVFFDLDNTLIDWQRVKDEVAKSITGELSASSPDKPIQEVVKLLNQAMIRAFGEYGLGRLTRQAAEIQVTQALQQFGFSHLEAHFLAERCFVLGIECSRPLINRQVLATLWEQYVLGIISNGPKDYQLAKLKHCRLDKYFDVMVYSSDLGIAKPSKRIFEVALRKVPVAPEEAIMVGDSWEKDVLGAIFAGMSGVWYHSDCEPNYGSEEKNTIATCVSSLSELPKVLDRFKPISCRH